MGGEVGNIQWHIGKGDIDAALALIKTSLQEGNAQPAEPPASTERPTERPKHGNAARIEALHLRIRHLKDAGEAHSESGIFRLEREIYDLEQQANGDEWSDEIDN